ncbi:mechanosensitive ion channel [Pelagovum pacificum]|uniref:Mechanosensitive ion channel n=2 Tax=Pelagovum pacificum TaxID=2588711 RepID=A0A5C5GHT8_9RHOB|nr:mechanosensitive ion channel [Pelagovum pacificum]TNY34332.1 mechanosensitive ion channel [Pelagovum pacificum]
MRAMADAYQTTPARNAGAATDTPEPGEDMAADLSGGAVTADEGEPRRTTDESADPVEARPVEAASPEARRFDNDPRTSEDLSEPGAPGYPADPAATYTDTEVAAAIAEAEGRRRRGPLYFLARHWHWPALAYLLVMFVIVMVSPGNAAFRTITASGQVLLVGLIGLAVSGFLTRAMVRGVILPTGVSARMPMLERRLNRFVPRTLFILRALIFVLVVFFALDAISLIDLRGWLTSQFGIAVTGTIISVALVLLGAFAVWLAMTSWVDYRLNPEFGDVATAREHTLLALFRNAATIALIIITMMFVLSEVGLDIAPLLASAGVLGLAIGFGAQKMVQDIITGIFIQFENAMNVGDVVTVGGTTGVVERLTIRSVSLRDLSGTFHIIPFSSVDMVSNYMRDFGYFVCDMGVAYRENVEEVRQAMLDAFEELRMDPDQNAGIMDDLEWFGLNSFGDSAVVLRARIKCLPGKQWGVGRAYNGILKRVFDERGIEIPFPHQTIYLGESKDGKTQSVKVDLEGNVTS